MRVLLATVGTSVLGHWKERYQELSDESRRRIVSALTRLPHGDRRLGAELHSLHSLVEQGQLATGDRVYFLVSDTKEGRFVGHMLTDVVGIWGFRTKEPEMIRNLQGDNPGAFQQGLRNLVKAIARLYREHASQSDRVLLNATGGYKAQIAFAALIGQVFHVPVYYQFENFPAAIELPPMPVSFDMELWLSYRHVFEALDEGDGGEPLKGDDPLVKSPSHAPELQVLLDRSHGLVTLNALGTLYHEGFKLRFQAQAAHLLPKDAGIATEEKKISFEDGNSGKHRGLTVWLDRLCRVPYVTRLQTFYYNPRLAGRCSVEPDPVHSDRVIATYAAHGATTKVYVFLSEDDPGKARAAAADLAQRVS